MMRVIARPQGDAPPEIRDRWIGLVLPVVENDTAMVGGMLTRTVLLGGGGYVVRRADAVTILGQTHPDARVWWESSVVGRPDLVFDRECAEILPD